MIPEDSTDWVYAHNKGCSNFGCYFKPWSNCSRGSVGGRLVPDPKPSQNPNFKPWSNCSRGSIGGRLVPDPKPSLNPKP